jgi:glutamyl-tRNA synthetase
VRTYREGGTPPGRLLAELARSLGWTVPDEVTAADLQGHWRTELVERGLSLPSS